MDLETLGGWLVKAGIFALQIAFLYGVVRLVKLGGGLRLSNPFQPGWNHLHGLYGSTVAPRRTESASARIGAVSYNSALEICFDAGELVLRKVFFSSAMLRIPYAHIKLVQAPKQDTIFRIPIRTDGLFKVSGVEILLKTDVANRLIGRLPAA